MNLTRYQHYTFEELITAVNRKKLEPIFTFEYVCDRDRGFKNGQDFNGSDIPNGIWPKLVLPIQGNVIQCIWEKYTNPVLPAVPNDGVWLQFNNDLRIPKFGFNISTRFVTPFYNLIFSNVKQEVITHVTPAILGNDYFPISPTKDTNVNGLLVGSKFSTLNSVTFSRLKSYVNIAPAGGTAQAEVYADNAGVIGTLLWTSNITICSPFMSLTNFDGISTTLPAGTYWLVVRKVNGITMQVKYTPTASVAGHADDGLGNPVYVSNTSVCNYIEYNINTIDYRHFYFLCGTMEYRELAKYDDIHQSILTRLLAIVT